MTAFTGAKPEDGGNRVQCLYCGANNFPASPTCWQCGRPLKALPANAPSAEQSAGSRPSYASAASPGGRPASVGPALSVLAPKAAAALGLMFPYIGLPVGIVFLMLDDDRKAQLGWMAIWWSSAGSVLSLLFFLATMGPTLAVLKSLIPGLPGAGHGGGLPSLPSPSGDPSDLNLIIPHLWSGYGQIVQAFWHKLAFCGPCCRV